MQSGSANGKYIRWAIFVSCNLHSFSISATKKKITTNLMGLKDINLFPDIS